MTDLIDAAAGEAGVRVLGVTNATCKSTWRDVRPVSHEEASAIASRLIAGSFRRDGERLEDGKRPRFSIPTRLDHDDDCLLMAYIEQRAASEAAFDLIAASQDGPGWVAAPDEWLPSRRVRAAEGVQTFMGSRYGSAPDYHEALLMVDALLAAAPAAPLPANIGADSPRVREEARPLDDWHEDTGNVVWWKFPVDEPPWVGTPLCSEWPGYHTHWTPLPPPPSSGAE